MKNLCKKIGKIFGTMGAFLFSIWNKVLAKIDFDYVPTGEPVYGVPSPGSKFLDKIVAFGKLFIIPLIILIGLFIYFRKKDKEKYANKITIIKRLLIIISIIFGVYVYYLIVKYL